MEKLKLKKKKPKIQFSGAFCSVWRSMWCKTAFATVTSHHTKRHAIEFRAFHKSLQLHSDRKKKKNRATNKMHGQTFVFVIHIDATFIVIMFNVVPNPKTKYLTFILIASAIWDCIFLSILLSYVIKSNRRMVLPTIQFPFQMNSINRAAIVLKEFFVVKNKNKNKNKNLNSNGNTSSHMVNNALKITFLWNRQQSNDEIPLKWLFDRHSMEINLEMSIIFHVCLWWKLENAANLAIWQSKPFRSLSFSKLKMKWFQMPFNYSNGSYAHQWWN